MQDSTDVTWGQVYNDFKGALSGAADALKTGSEHVYEVLVRQQVVNSITWVIIYILMIIVLITIWKIVYRVIKESSNMEELFALPVALTCVVGITFLVTIGDTVTGFINPEYGAIQEVREFIRRY